QDDSAVVYLNGAETRRWNLPQTGTITYTTLANSSMASAGERTWIPFSVDPAELVTGTNTIAAEIHQRNGDSSDISFGLELLAGTEPFVTRGPYLQLATPTSIFVRWRTEVATDSRVRFGTLQGSLGSSVDDLAATTDHEVLVSGLSPDTTYHYSVGTTTAELAGDDGAHRFTTPPTAGTAQATRIWVLGDSGMANDSSRAVRDAYLAFTGATPTDMVLMLGDNAYPDGKDFEYQGAVFDTYPSVLRQTSFWLARGNHDKNLNLFQTQLTLPKAGEAGGLGSGSESYYSFDHANVHFVCLDSFGSNRAVGAPMYNWAQADLGSTSQEWIVAYWHHPPYSKGSHDSDTETELMGMRQNFLPLLESFGVDLVLCGHSHAYERSYLMDGHDGLSTTLTEEHKLAPGDGRLDGDGAYAKGAVANDGAVYAVAGSSGKLSPGDLDHPAMFHSVLVLGSVVLDVDDTQLDVQFLTDAGVVEDHFTIVHGPWSSRGHGLAGTNGVPSLVGTGTLQPLSPLTVTLTGALESAAATLIVGFSEIEANFKGGVMVPAVDVLIGGFDTGPSGSIALPATLPGNVPPGFTFTLQYWIVDGAGPVGVSASNGLSGTTP
ncbi:MAG: purple acid phosphatase family protein, partial [Planctomycetota bacterium]